jgi:hypothetical protein
MDKSCNFIQCIHEKKIVRSSSMDRSAEEDSPKNYFCLFLNLIQIYMNFRSLEIFWKKKKELAPLGRICPWPN